MNINYFEIANNVRRAIEGFLDRIVAILVGDISNGGDNGT